MCATRMPPLVHIFRGTFVHSTWTCPMEVLRDHLLGVSDSGKVSGRGVWRTPTGGWTGGSTLPTCAARSTEFAPSRAGAAAPELNLSVWLFGERQESPGAAFVGWTGSKVFPVAGSLGVLQPTFVAISRPGCIEGGARLCPRKS